MVPPRLGQDSAHAHGRVGVERLEHDARRVRLVVFRDGHGRLRGAALTDEHDRLESLLDDGIGERLDVGERVRRVAGEVRPSHVPFGAGLGLFGEIIEGRVLRVDAAGNAFLHERLRGGIQLFHITRNHETFFQRSFAHSSKRRREVPVPTSACDGVVYVRPPSGSFLKVH